MGVRGEALQRVNRPFPGRDNGQQPARSRFNPPSRPGQRLRECGAGTMDWDQAVAVSLVHQNSVPFGKPIIDNFLNELRARSRAAFLRGRLSRASRTAADAAVRAAWLCALAVL
jgi:hypothetical protein